MDTPCREDEHAFSTVGCRCSYNSIWPIAQECSSSFSLMTASRIRLLLMSYRQEPRAVDSVALFAGEKHLQLSYEVESVIPHQVAGDSVRLTQVLINLLHNAVKFTEVGEVSIRVSLLDLRADTATVGMVVSDTGVGMTEQMVSRLFSAELNASSGGYGLGLGIVKQLVSAMGGRLEIESEVGRGSQFTCTITCKLPE